MFFHLRRDRDALRGKDGAILLDGTSARNAKQIEHNIESVGVPLRQVKLLISSHAHDDHVGALAEIKQATGARFLASAGDRAALERGAPLGDTRHAVRLFPPIRVDGVVEDGQTIRWGGVALTAHMTPGHTSGCTSWSTTVREAGALRRVLFPCSITVAGNRLVGNRAYPRIASDYRATFAKLEGMQADIILPGHPEMAGVFEKEARREAGEADAFVDPAALARIVAASRADFQSAFDRERADVPDGGREPARGVGRAAG